MFMELIANIVIPQNASEWEGAEGKCCTGPVDINLCHLIHISIVSYLIAIPFKPPEKVQNWR